MINNKLIKKPMKREIKFTYDIFKQYRDKLTSIEYILSEFIDNSIASYENGNDLKNFDGLEINILIEDFHNNRQEITIVDNANGMDQKELMYSMQPNFKVDKEGINLNQYFYGMKLGIFWLGESVQIYSKKSNDYEYKLNFSLKNNNSNIPESISEQSFDRIIKTKSGTSIKITDIYQEHMISKNDIQSIKQAIGSRYSGILKSKNSNGCKIIISYILNNSTKIHEIITPFIINAYSLESTFNEMENNKNILFDKNKYISNVKKVLNSNEFMHNKNELKNICNGRDIGKDFLNGEPLIFDYLDKIGGKSVNIKWGILSLEYDKNNEGYRKYNGFKLIHHKRAIRHAPNDKKIKDTNLSMSAYSFGEPVGGKGNSSIMRLFGEIDLTGICKPEENKKNFIWENHKLEKRNIDEICKKIWEATKFFINYVLLESEKEAKMQKSLTSKKAQNVIKKETNEYYSELNYLGQEDNGNVQKYQFKDFIFRLQHVQYDENGDAFDLEFSDKNKDEIFIKINTNHKMWSEFLGNPQSATKFKSRTLYPLAICFAICKMKYDYEMDTSPENGTKNFLSKIIDQNCTFENLINKIIKEFDGK